MKVNILIILFFFIFNLKLIATDYYYIDYFPNIEPIKTFCDNFKKRINSKKINFFIIKDKNIFKSSKEILNAVQSNIIQLAILPAWTINANLQGVLKNINYEDYNTILFNLSIPYRERLRDYGLFLLDVYYMGKYAIYSNFRIDKKDNNLILGSLFKIKSNKFKRILLIDDTVNVKGLLKSEIINSALLTPIQYYYFNLNNSTISYKNKINNIYSYIVIVVNNVFWNNLNFNYKSLLWSFIYNYRKKFQKDITKLNIYIKNQISQNLLIFNLGNIIY